MKPINALLTILFLLLITKTLDACTNFIVTPGASADGSCMLVYTNDGEWLYQLNKTPAMDHSPSDSLEFTSWRNGVAGKIPQKEHTYACVGFQMNEHQLAIGETTFTGREELWNKSKYLQYWHLMRLALERAKTAREAIKVMTSLAETYGYGSEGESFSIIDPNEAWILEMIGTGENGEGAIWVAMRIPDGYVSAHANMARIGEFPDDDPDNCLYSKNIIDFAIEHNYYDPDSGKAFRFNEVYNPATPDRLKYCETRVWSIFRKVAPSKNFSADYHRGKKDAKRYPLWIKPDKKLKLDDVFNIVRDHYEGTDYDMTKGLTAGPFGNPNRFRPLSWEYDSLDYSWERPVSTMNTAFSFVAQSRSYLPDPIGGIVWYGVDDTYTTCYFPVYCSVNEISKPFASGDIKKFSWDSAWWVFNFVANYINIRYADMIADVKEVQNRLETQFIKEQDSLIQKFKTLNKNDQIEMLNKYSWDAGKKVHQEWVELAEHLITKYNDGYIKNSKGQPKENGYPLEWKRKIIKYEKEKYLIPEWQDNNKYEHQAF